MYIFQTYYFECNAPSLCYGYLKKPSLFCERATADPQGLYSERAYLKSAPLSSIKIHELVFFGFEVVFIV